MVIGGSDTGKTTTAGAIASALAAGGAVGVVDLDMGQSSIGPPATVGWGVMDGPGGTLAGVDAEGIYFTGSTSPVGNLLPTLVGAKLMADGALGRCARAVVDTTGLVAEPSGRVLKQYKVELLRPDVVVAMEREDELDHIIAPLERRVVRVLRVRASKRVVPRTPAERAGYRTARLRDYLAGSSVIEVRTGDTALEFTRDYLCRDGDFPGRVASLRDPLGRDISVGVVEGADLSTGRVFVRVPARIAETAAGRGPAPFTTLMVGSATVDPDVFRG